MLKHQNDLRLRLNHIVQLGDVWVIDPLHDLDLSSDGFLPLNVLHFLFLVDFERDFLIGLLAHAQEY